MSIAPGTISRLSFGCSNLLGEKTSQEGLKLLEAAYDVGIRSFDVARVYNFGDAERLVGQFASSRRDELTITTKFGLAPSANVARMGALIKGVRRIMRSSNAIRKLVRRNISAITQGGQFNVQAARASLETSLRVLGTDYIDIYLMHEAGADDCDDAILAFLDQMHREGKIRSYGVGSGYSSIQQIAKLKPLFLEVAQFESGSLNNNRRDFERVRPPSTRLVITHGSFAGADDLVNAISRQAPQLPLWSDRVGFDLAATGNLHAALLRCALRANPDGKVIFRASRPDRIIANIRALETSYEDKQLDALERICREASLHHA